MTKNQTTKTVRVRFAPSPTGDPHLGNIRSAVFDWLYARQTGGTFIARLEDTDQNRYVPGSAEPIFEILNWLGLEPDEGVYLDGQGKLAQKGNYGPYIQSERLAIYQKYAQELLDAGKAYRCFATPEELEAMRQAQAAAHQPPRYDRRFRDLPREKSDQKAAAGEKYVIRQKMPLTGEVLVEDLVRGQIVFQAAELEDHVLLKSDGYPTYQLANVVDDHLMEISHVFRGEEWLPSAPKNLLLYQDFGWEPPYYVTLPLILGPDKTKLSKRRGAEPARAYRDRGYLPEGILNMIALFGWNPGTEEEMMTPERLIELFSLERIQKSPAIFDPVRLDYVSGWHIRQLDYQKVADLMLPYLEKAGLWPIPVDRLLLSQAPEAYLLAVATELRERFKHFDETEAIAWFFFRRPEVTAELQALVVPKKSTPEITLSILKQSLEILKEVSNWDRSGLEAALAGLIEEQGGNKGAVLWPIRAALSGEPASPGAYEMLEILGQAESLYRLRGILA